jgi:replicative DNA helicase
MFTFAQNMAKAIDSMDKYSWKRGVQGGLDFGFPQLTNAFEVLTTGLFLVAGSANTGKSALMLQMAWQITQANKDNAVCLYFSLDDNINDILPRVIAMDQKIPINAVSKPAKYEHLTDVMIRRTAGLNKLKDSAGWFNMLDSSSGSSIEFIKRKTEEYHKEVKAAGKQLVVFIDNFHDITTDDQRLNADTKLKFDHIATVLADMCTIMDLPILCTAELRKLNGNRRPAVDDVRETVKIAYIAKAILLCFNEVGLKGQNADVYYNRPGSTDKFPVLEVHIGKNKYSSYKGRVFYEFIPEFSCLKEVPPEGAQTYLSQIT